MGWFNNMFNRTKKRLDYDVEKIVHASIRQSMLPKYRQRETQERWKQQFYLYDGIISRGEFRSKNIIDNLKLIRDINPDAAMSVWNFLRLSNSGHELEVYTPNGTLNKAATDDLNKLAARVGKLYGGGTDQLINVLLLTAFTQGAICLEVELNDALNDVVDFHAVDPSTVDFRTDKETGELQLVQKQSDGQYKILNQEQVFYFGYDSDISDPYGRSPILPVLQIVFFQIQVLKDLQKVVHHQGHKRFDIKVVEAAIIENMPDEIKHQGPDVVRDYVSSYISDVQAQMSELEPDDDFFHTDSIEIDLAGGAMQSSIDVTRVMDVINQQIVTALKQLPILLGRNEGTTETHGSIQWQIYVKGIESIQRGIKRILERAYNVALQVKGVQGSAKLTFDEIQTSDRQKEATAEKTETETKIMQINQGWIDNDEAANYMVGHDAVSEPIKNTIPAMSESNNGETEDDETTNDRFAKVTPLKKKYLIRANDDEDEYVAGIKEDWASDVAKITSNATQSFFDLLQDQVKEYIDRLKKAPNIPARVYVDVKSFRQFMRDETPEPTPQFIHWVRKNLLSDSEKQTEFIKEELQIWIKETVELTGSMSLIELGLDVEFNSQDQKLLRYLQERSLRSAQLIQGVSDESVIMNLWDVVYEGHYSIEKAAESLMDEFAFSKNRSRVIARTEIISAGRTGQYFADDQSGMVIGKKWMAAMQEGRTRPGHLKASGQVVKFDEPFKVENKNGEIELLLYPGDTSYSPSPSNTIQCRCWYKRILEGEKLE
ncbi:phage minor head protein [Peribacillus frigoritolerans]|uniref:phage minor head protein n=1 Tax=Peribacillus frigoritolerans TaxID=450367 RepID=UPI0021D22BCB|nr:phage minor head protein [Peribacillus frigoritolerans]MCU6603776.1 phage minor head protein [Peribacillus frigoritolerans]